MRGPPTGVLLAAGEGKRMGRIGDHLPKACLPVANRPLIAHHIDLLRELGVREVVVVVGHRREAVQAALDAAADGCMRIRMVEQPKRRGIAHALALARPLVETPELVLVLADTFYEPAQPMLGLDRLAEGSPRPAAVLSTRRVTDPALIRRECTIELDADGDVARIVEKPQQPLSEWKPCGVYFFSDAIFDAIDRTEASPLRGEVELTDSIQTLIDMGRRVTTAPTLNWDSNITTPADLLAANLHALRSAGATRLVADDAFVHPDAHLSEVVVGPGARIETPAVLERVVLLPGAIVDVETPQRDRVILEREPIDASATSP